MAWPPLSGLPHPSTDQIPLVSQLGGTQGHLYTNLHPFPFFFFFSWLCWAFVAAQAFSLVVTSGVCSLVVVRGLLIVLASLAAERRLQVRGLQQLWLTV